MNTTLLQHAESELQQMLAEPNATPYLAHYKLSNDADVLFEVKENVRSDFRLLEQLFRSFPAVSVWVVATCLSERYGEDGDATCYGLIEEAFGFSYILSPAERGTLRWCFRRAVARLGLALPAEGDIVAGVGKAVLRAQPADDFFTQAGVAVAQAPKLAEMFNRARGRFGTPTADDSTNALVEWEREAIIEFCPAGIRRMPKTILFGGNGYHAGVYARLLGGDVPRNEFERSLSEAQARQPKPTSEFNPRLICIDGDLFVQDANGTGAFSVNLQAEKKTVRTGGTVRLTTPWPEMVMCQSLRATTPPRVLEVFSDESRVLLFDAITGRLLTRVGFKTETLLVNATDVIAVSRDAFSVGDEGAHNAGVEAFILYAELRAPTQLKFADREIRLTPRPRPMIRVSTPHGIVGRYRSIPFFGSLDAVEVDNRSASAEEGGIELELHISHPAMTPAVVPCIAGDDAGRARIDLTSLLPSTGDFGMLKLELKPKGSQRVLMRETCWLWPGLSGFEVGRAFRASSLPPNWDHERTEHIRQNESGVLQLDEPGASPFLHAVLRFRQHDDADGEREPLAEFVLPPPGISASLREANGKERALRMGELVALSPEDGATIVIRSSDASVRLDVQGIKEEVSFDRFGMRRLSSSSLASGEAIGGGHRKILAEHRNRSGIWETLVRLTDVATALQFKLLTEGDRELVQLALPREVHRIRVCGRGLMFEGDVELSEANGRLLVDRSDSTLSVCCSFRRQAVPRADLYVLRVEVDLGDGRWRMLTNARRDHYEWAMNVGSVTVAAYEGEIDVHALLTRLTVVLNQCAAHPCWPTIEDNVLPMWTQLTHDLFDSGEDGQAAVINSAALSWDEGASSTWVPIVHPLQAELNTFAPPVHLFSPQVGKTAAPGFEHIAYLHRTGGTGDVQVAAANARVSSMFYMGFRNALAVNRRKETALRGFSFSAFIEALAGVPSENREALWTVRQDRLTPGHHDWCCQKYAERLQDMYIDGQNSLRVGALRELGKLAAGAAQDLGEKRVHLAPPPRLLESYTDDDKILFENSPLLLSLLAKHSRRGKCQPLVSAIRARSAMSTRDTLQGIGLLTRLAPELFGFYLLLWELAYMGED